MSKELNTSLLATMIRKKRGSMGLRDAAKEIGSLSATTLSRVEQGKVPDVDSFLKICRWLEMAPEKFATEPVRTSKKAVTVMSHQDVIVTNLRADKTLDKEVVKALVEMIQVAYRFKPKK